MLTRDVFAVANLLVPEGCTQDTGKTADFGSGSAHVKSFRNVSRQQSPIPAHVLATEIAEICCTKLKLWYFK